MTLQQGYQLTIITAQTQVLHFYEKLVYPIISKPYFDARIEYYQMKKIL